MAGLLNASQAPQQAQAASGAILTEIQRGVEEKVSPQIRKSYMALTVTGMKIMFSESTGKRIMQKLQSSKDIVSDVSQGVANILAMVFNDVSQRMPQDQKEQLMAATMPASIMLMAQALDTWEKLTGETVTSELAAQCSSATTKAIMAKFEITPEKARQAVTRGQQPKGQQPPAAQPPAGV